MFAGWVLVDAALSPAVVALLQLLVVEVLNTCFLLCICGAMLQQSTRTNAACQQILVLASVTNLPIMMLKMRRDLLGESAFIRNVNDGLHRQPAMSLLLLSDLFFMSRTTFSPSSIWCQRSPHRLAACGTRGASRRAVLLLLCCWPSGARALLLWLLVAVVEVLLLLVMLMLLPLVIVIQQ